MKNTNIYTGYHYPVQIISHAVWLNYRFNLSYRDIEKITHSIPPSEQSRYPITLPKLLPAVHARSEPGRRSISNTYRGRQRETVGKLAVLQK
jgi:hypothetical protein